MRCSSSRHKHDYRPKLQLFSVALAHFLKLKLLHSFLIACRKLKLCPPGAHVGHFAERLSTKSFPGFLSHRLRGVLCQHWPDLGEGTFAPVNTATAIKYKNVLTNIGRGFNADTGVFTAPRRGLYVFHLTAYASVIQPPFFGPVLKRNGEALAEPLLMHTVGGRDSVSRIVVLQLEAADRVYVELPANAFFTSMSFGKLNAFSGFLLAPM